MSSPTVVDPVVATSARRRWLAMPFIALGVSMIIVDSTIVNVAIPTIIDDLGLTPTDAEWVNSVYSLVFATLLITFGRLGDRFGRRLLFMVGTVVFVLASMLAAVSTSPEMLIAARVVQGVGGAMILPTSLSTVNAIFRGRERAIAFAIWGSVIGGTAALGPLLGGWLTTSYSWRWAFGINIPIGIVIVLGLLFLVPETKDPQVRRGADVLGMALSSLAMFTLVFALIEAQSYGWWTPVKTLELAGFDWRFGISFVPLFILVSIVSIVLFWFWEKRRLRRDEVVLVDLRLFRIGSFTYGNVTALIVSLGEFGLLFALPLFLQGVLAYSAFDTGLVLLSLALGAFLASPVAAQIAIRRGGRTVVRLGLLLEVVGIAALGMSITADTTGWKLSPWLFVYGMGVGLATAQLTGVILADVPVEESGQGSGVQSTFRQVGSALGTAILGAILFASLSNDTFTRLVDAGVPEQQATQVSEAVRNTSGQAILALERTPGQETVAAAAEQGFVDSARRVAWAAAGFVLLGLLATFKLPPDTGENRARRPEDDEAGEVAAAGPDPDGAD